MIKSITSDGHKVLESGSVILYSQNATALITIDVGMGFVIKIEIEFAEETDAKRGIKKEIIEDDNYIKFVCVNFDNSFGTGTIVPLELAKLDDKKIDLHIWTNILGDKSSGCTRKIDYTFFIEEKNEKTI